MTTEKGAILRDDGRFFIEHNENYPADRGNGFLIHRIVLPNGGESVECVGGYDARSMGRWQADIATSRTEVHPIGEYDSRELAIVALWAARHRAYVNGRQ
ncbi:hypothetical protein [Burkholderia gladioli]|uniref:hypothetical protein n=1 Tax=Burkholderia gladioli TaxID=28095 RepID=UPI00163F49A2|nr:hypothetical protein [Burkholderia gladioli]